MGITEFAKWLVEFVHQFGYVGLFIMAFLESTFVPIPSELTMVPAGYLVQQGKMNFWLVWLSTTSGTLFGSMFCYWLALVMGRRVLNAYGKYMFFPPAKMEKLDNYFRSHGEISIFTGRLIPGVRHVISFPAGLARMNLKKFCIYTGVGGGLWMLTLITVGYLIGDNPELVHAYMPYITGAVVTTVLVLVLGYMYRLRKMKLLNARKETNGLA